MLLVLRLELQDEVAKVLVPFDPILQLLQALELLLGDDAVFNMQAFELRDQGEDLPQLEKVLEAQVRVVEAQLSEFLIVLLTVNEHLKHLLAVLWLYQDALVLKA